MTAVLAGQSRQSPRGGDRTGNGAGSVARALRERWHAHKPPMSNEATSILLVTMIVGGVVLRVINLDAQTTYGFDEHQYAGVAHRYLLGTFDLSNCHPPLSPLLISVGMLLMGYNPVGWRFVPLCFGIQSIVLAYLLGSALFQDKKAGWFAAAFMAVDGFFITYSRASLPDGILACVFLWVMLAAVTARGWGGVLVCALLVGAAASIKWVGLLAGIPACIAILALKRAHWTTLAAFAVVPLVHLVVWMFGLWVMQSPNDPAAVLKAMDQLRKTHLGFVHGRNALESLWYTWPVIYHPIIVKISTLRGHLRLASSAGNPVLFAGADLCLVGLPLVGGVMALRRSWRKLWTQWFEARETRALALLLVTWVSVMLLWMSERIVTYYYHYLTAWGFALLLLGGVVAHLDRRHPRLVLGFVAVVLAVSVTMAPVWSEMSVSDTTAHRLLPFRTWW